MFGLFKRSKAKEENKYIVILNVLGAMFEDGKGLEKSFNQMFPKLLDKASLKELKEVLLSERGKTRPKVIFFSPIAPVERQVDGLFLQSIKEPDAEEHICGCGGLLSGCCGGYNIENGSSVKGIHRISHIPEFVGNMKYGRHFHTPSVGFTLSDDGCEELAVKAKEI